MKTLFVIAAIVLLAIWFVVDFVWFRALNERAGDLNEVSDKLDKLDRELQMKKAQLQTEEDRQRGVAKIQEERQRKLDELNKVLNEKDQKLDEKAALLDARAKELKDYAEILDGVQASLADREQKNRDDEPVDVSAAMKELGEKIELVKQRGSLKDADKYLDEMRGREPEKPVKKAKKGGKK